MTAAPRLIAAAILLSSYVPLASANEIAVYATGPYQVWGGNSALPDITVDDGSGNMIVVPGYFDTPNMGYVFLGDASNNATFSGAYDYFVVGTTSLFSLDAVELDYAILDFVDYGNVHLPWQFDAFGNLIGNRLDYSHHANVWDQDGLTDDVGIPPGKGFAPGGPFQGYVAIGPAESIPSPGSIWLIAASLFSIVSRHLRGNRVRAAWQCRVV